MKKTLLIFSKYFSVVFFLLILFSQNSFAKTVEISPESTTQTPKASEIPPQYRLNTNPDVPQNLNTYTQSVFFEIMSTASCFLAGSDPINPHAKCLGLDTKTGKLGYMESNQGGLTGIMGNMIAQTYNIPISSSHYVHYIASNFGLSKTSYAQINSGPSGNTPAGQGVGFIGLYPLLPIWTIFRNLTYLMFVLVFILLGLGIMFRVNIDARTVMTLQNRIPRIIIGLLLITLSYAIAGFLIDMMYVFTYLVINTFQIQGLSYLANINTNPLSAVGYFGNGIFGIAWSPAESSGKIIASLFDGTIGSIIGAAVGAILGAFVGSSLPIPGVSATGLGLAGGALAGYAGSSYVLQWGAITIAYLIIIVALFSALFRVWFMLIKAYVYIVLGVIFSPLWIMSGLLPIGGGGFGAWIRSLIANLAVFPTVILIFMVGKTVIDNVKNSAPNAYNFTPPMVGSLGDDSLNAIASLIGLGLILIMPETLNIVKSTLKAPDFKLSSAAGRAIGAGQSFWSKPAGRAWHELAGEKKDGTRGILRSTAEEKAGAIAKRVPVFGKGLNWYQKRREDERARARHRMYGTELPEHLREAEPAAPATEASTAHTDNPPETDESGENQPSGAPTA